MHARAIYNAVTQGRTVQKDGSNLPNPPVNHTLKFVGPEQTIIV